MDTTKPAANFQPHSVQYTPIDRSMERRVLALVSPSNSSLAFVITKSRANLNFASNRPRAPSPPAAPLPMREPRFAPAGCRSTARLNSATRAAHADPFRRRAGGIDGGCRPRRPLTAFVDHGGASLGHRLDDLRNVGHHDGAVGERHRQCLVAPAAPPVRALADGGANQ